MVSHFLRWTLLNFSSQFPINHGQQVVRQLDKSYTQWLIHKMRLGAHYCRNFVLIFSCIILERVFVGSIVNIRNECIFYGLVGQWIWARNQQNIQEPGFPHEPRKKDIHSVSKLLKGYDHVCLIPILQNSQHADKRRLSLFPFTCDSVHCVPDWGLRSVGAAAMVRWGLVRGIRQQVQQLGTMGRRILGTSLGRRFLGWLKGKIQMFFLYSFKHYLFRSFRV